MALSRTPGPLRDDNPEDINDGTNGRQKSPIPGALKYDATTPVSARSRGRGQPAASMPVLLKPGFHGPLIAKLQQLLNARVQPSPNLKIDGIFGPRTRAAVVSFQESRYEAPNGFVDKKTWYHLLAASTITANTTANTETAQSTAPPKALPAQAADVSKWSLERKFSEMVNRVPSKLPSEIRAQFIGLVQPQTLAIGIGIFAASYVFGVGELLTVGLLLIIGEQALFELVDAVQTTSLAATQRELDEGAEHLARVISIVGVMAFVGWLSRFVPKGRGAGKARETQPTEKTKTVEKLAVRVKTETAPKAEPGMETYSRPSGFRKGVREKVWNDAVEESTGRVRDPQTGRFISAKEDWDMGHKPGLEFRKHKQSAQDRGISRKQFLDEYNKPDHYRPELPSSNRNHISEAEDDLYFGD